MNICFFSFLKKEVFMPFNSSCPSVDSFRASSLGLDAASHIHPGEVVLATEAANAYR
jgi:hypothetical protein